MITKTKENRMTKNIHDYELKIGDIWHEPDCYRNFESWTIILSNTENDESRFPCILKRPNKEPELRCLSRDVIIKGATLLPQRASLSEILIGLQILRRSE